MRSLLFLVLLLSPISVFAAASLDGTDDGYTVNDPNKTGFTYTVCAWVNPSSFPGGRTIFYYGQGTDGGAAAGWDVISQGSGDIRFNNYYTTYAIHQTVAGVLTTSTWNHLCVVSNAGSITVYRDGTSISSFNNGAGTSQSSTHDFGVGVNAPNTGGFGYGDFPGSISQVAYWDEALSEANVDLMADKSTCPTDITPVPEIFLEMDALPATDTSANGFSVTETGTPSLVSDPTGLPCGTTTSYLPVLQAIGAIR